MTISLWDSALFRDMVSTAQMRAVFCDESRIRAWLEVLSAQAEIQGMAGIIPSESAAEIVAAATCLQLDPEETVKEIAEQAARVGRPVLPLVRRLSAACPGQAGEWVHFHGTTQDILDTGAALQQARAMALVQAELIGVTAALCDLAELHATTAMAGRTMRGQLLSASRWPAGQWSFGGPPSVCRKSPSGRSAASSVAPWEALHRLRRAVPGSGAR